ncbi:MAG TPA: hypothetical protein VH331_07630 [Allosphingosinicella sp.]|jgi:hypothetical protein|nr:hypothetical protein [Allosphingosinicella sp.]
MEVSAQPAPGIRIPTGEELRFRNAENGAFPGTAMIYDRIRARLLAGGYEPRAVVGILSHAAADGLSAFVKDRNLPEIDIRLPRPSLAEEQCAATRLRELVAELRSEEGEVRHRRPEDVFIEGQHATEADTVRVLPSYMLTLYGVARPLKGDCSGWPHRRPSMARWRVPVRVMATGNVVVDTAVRAALDRLHREVPGLPIDDRSFGASSRRVNFWLGNPAVPAEVFFEGVRGCIEKSRCSLSQIAGASGADRGSSRQALASDLYVSRPYDRGGGRPVAVVHLNEHGDIDGAACGSADLGVQTAGGGKTQFEPRDVILCLAQGLGALPGALTDASRANLSDQDGTLSQSLQQLRILYPGK